MVRFLEQERTDNRELIIFPLKELVGLQDSRLGVDFRLRVGESCIIGLTYVIEK